MDERLKKEIFQRFENLPEDVQAVILSSDFPQKIETIREKHSLTIDQAGDLSNESTFIMIGLERPSAFVDNVRKTLDLTPEKASAVATDVNELIFKEIRESLKHIHAKDEPSAKMPIETAPAAPKTFEPPIPPPPTDDTVRIEPAPIEEQTVPENLPSGAPPIAWKTPGEETPVPPSRFNDPPPAPLEAAPRFSSARSPQPFAMADIPKKEPVISVTEMASVIPQPSNPTQRPVAPATTQRPMQNTVIKGFADKQSGGDMQPQGGIVGQKLSTTTTLPREEKRYIVDPYREPVE